ncbi:MAG: UDP-2,3-diacylglucosamine diphosphatase [Gammaproteobacteria bacterium]
MSIAFIADLHLDPSNAEMANLFLKFLETTEAETLYILGDLFEVWVGDDIATVFSRKITEALKSFTHSGKKCFIIHGNRDFLLGKRFCLETGCILLNDPYALEIFGKKTLLMHGDLLCTDDVRYQRYRRLVHNRLIQTIFLGLPARIRFSIAKHLRKKSKAHTKKAQAAIMDVNQQTVEKYMSHYQAELLIHGHTHRPGNHHFQHRQRMVLGAWHKAGNAIIWHEGKSPEYLSEI